MRNLFFLFLALPLLSHAQQDKKSIDAHKIEAAVQIDGKLDDTAWKGAPTAHNFIMFEPTNGAPEPYPFRSEVKVMYSDEAIYIGAMLYDPSPDSILTQLTQRDDFNQNNDWFGFFINPYNDGLSDFNFWVTAAGVQADSKTTEENDDFSLNSVWKSAVRITDSGWVCEVRIPYLALRFPETPVKDWGLNMIRNIRRNRQQYSWSFLDISSGNRLEYQTGLLTNMTNINPPVRLSLMPYISTYVDDFDGNTTYDFNAGLDLKYGINESFTLDMTLIPDFGQVVYDQQFLNLSPFENRFDENRQFFTEGTELFSMGDLFYSRRIGGAPKNITGQDLSSNDSIEIRQEYTRIINATKISGRTKNNLGIGFLNAITDDNYSVQIDSSGNEVRILTEPLTNYNVLVLDQRFNRNSSISFINTSVLRKGASRDANVSGLLSSFVTKDGRYQLKADLKMSNIFNPGKTIQGYSGRLRIAKESGKWRWAVNENISTDDYRINDLGFQTRNNQVRHYAEINHRIIQPKGIYNRYNATFFAVHESLYKPYVYEEFYLGLNTFFLLRSFFAYGVNASIRPVESYNYFEARSPGEKFRIPQNFNINGFISSDYRKVLALDASFSYDHWAEYTRDQYNLNLTPRIRLGDHFFAIPQVDLTIINNDYGWVGTSEEDIFFGQRNRYSFTAEAEAQYVFNPRSSVSLSMRHFYTDVDYVKTYTLRKDGYLDPDDGFSANDLNFNTFNIDLKYSWWFAPGSELVVLYRNVVAYNGNIIGLNYLENLDNVLNSPMQNNLSVKLTYFLDYNSVKNKLSS